MSDSELAPMALHSPDVTPTVGPLSRASPIASLSIAAPSSDSSDGSGRTNVPCSQLVDVDAPPVVSSADGRAVTYVVDVPCGEWGVVMRTADVGGVCSWWGYW